MVLNPTIEEVEMAIQPGWMTASEIAEKYDVPESTLRYWVKQKWITRDVKGKTAFYLEEEVAREKSKVHPRNKRGRPRKKIE